MNTNNVLGPRVAMAMGRSLAGASIEAVHDPSVPQRPGELISIDIRIIAQQDTLNAVRNSLGALIERLGLAPCPACDGTPPMPEAVLPRIGARLNQNDALLQDISNMANALNTLA